MFVILQNRESESTTPNCRNVNDKLHHYKNPSKRLELVQSGHHYQPPNVSYSLHEIVQNYLFGIKKRSLSSIYSLPYTEIKEKRKSYGVERHFQQYVSYIVAVSFIGVGNQKKKYLSAASH